MNPPIKHNRDALRVIVSAGSTTGVWPEDLPKGFPRPALIGVPFAFFFDKPDKQTARLASYPGPTAPSFEMVERGYMLSAARPGRHVIEVIDPVSGYIRELEVIAFHTDVMAWAPVSRSPGGWLHTMEQRYDVLRQLLRQATPADLEATALSTNVAPFGITSAMASNIINVPAFAPVLSEREEAAIAAIVDQRIAAFLSKQPKSATSAAANKA
jgi:hypothetical protein